MVAAARSAEEQVLLHCARGPIAAAERGALRALLDQPLSWSRLLSLAERHALLPLLAHALEGIGADITAPESIRAELRSAFLGNAARSLVLAAELPRILAQLSEAGIPALPYKGPLLAVDAYGNAALRRMRDLDVIIAPSALDRARTVLAKRGYRQYTRLLRGPLRLRLEYQCGMIRDADDALVELHWRIAPPNIVRSPSFEELWERRAMASFQGVMFPRMSNEDRLIALCIHGSKHGWMRLEWIASVAGVLANHPCDWAVVLRRATELRAQRMVRLGLMLARDLLDLPLDAVARQWVEGDAVAAELATRVSRGLFTDESSADADSLMAFQWRAQDAAAGKLRFLTYWPLVRLARRAAVSPRFGSTA